MSRFYEAFRRASADAGAAARRRGADHRFPDEPAEITPRHSRSIPIEAPGPIDEFPPPTLGAIVPVSPPERFQDWVTRSLRRAKEGIPHRPVVPPELYDRLDHVEVHVAGVEELLTKRLEEGEGRTLHLVERRLGVLQEDIARLAQRSAEREVQSISHSLRMQITLMGGIAIGLAVAALLKAFGVF